MLAIMHRSIEKGSTMGTHMLKRLTWRALAAVTLAGLPIIGLVSTVSTPMRFIGSLLRDPRLHFAAFVIAVVLLGVLMMSSLGSFQGISDPLQGWEHNQAQLATVHLPLR